MPRSGAAVPREETDRQPQALPAGEPRETFVSGSFGPDGSVFGRFGPDALASERFRHHDADAESYRVEVDRYWRRTASRRAATEARRADGFARADRAVARARRVERSDQAESPDPYREMLHTWARETAQEPPVASGRRTVSIRGHGAEGYASRNGLRTSAAERHRQLPRHERSGFQPDRVAMWAVLLGMVMVLAAAASAHAAVIAPHLH